jgi:hypothetical protein
MREGIGAAEAAAEAADATEEAAAEAAEAAATGGADAAALAAAIGASAPGPVLAGEAPRVPMKTAPATKTTATAAPAIIEVATVAGPVEGVAVQACGAGTGGVRLDSASDFIGSEGCDYGRHRRPRAGVQALQATGDGLRRVGHRPHAGACSRFGQWLRSDRCTATRAASHVLTRVAACRSGAVWSGGLPHGELAQAAAGQVGVDSRGEPGQEAIASSSGIGGVLDVLPVDQLELLGDGGCPLVPARGAGCRCGGGARGSGPG